MVLNEGLKVDLAHVLLFAKIELAVGDAVLRKPLDCQPSSFRWSACDNVDIKKMVERFQRGQGIFNQRDLLAFFFMESSKDFSFLVSCHTAKMVIEVLDVALA